MLHHDIVRPEPGPATRSFLFLHGILGSGNNLRSLARRLIARDPSWQAVLVDLRGHGRSPLPAGPHTLEACADDVAALAAGLGVPARAILGHSFGGKVAMALACRAEGVGAGLEHVVVVDSLPGARPGGRGSESVLAVVEALDNLPRSFDTREAFVAALVSAGMTKDIAAWLAMSLRKSEGAHVLGLDLDAIRALLDDYFASELWPAIDEAVAGPGGPRWHLVIGDRSPVFAEEDRAHARRLAAEGRATLDVLPAGHWVHVDDPEGLLRVVSDRVLDRSPTGAEARS